MSVTNYLNSKGFNCFEGHCEQNPGQVTDLKNVSNKSNIKNVMEIGFNGGHSAELFLKNNDNILLTSFDIGEHKYVNAAKEYIDMTYPNRHTLILGDSTITVSKFINDNVNVKFDLIFIDGGHSYEVAKSDLDNCIQLSHKDTIIIMDDTVFREEWVAYWNVGPTKIWKEYLEGNIMNQIESHDYFHGSGMSWGKYISSMNA